METWDSSAILEISIGSGWQIHNTETNGFERGKLSLFYVLEHKFSLQCFSIHWKFKYHYYFTKLLKCVKFKVQASIQIIPAGLRQNRKMEYFDQLMAFEEFGAKF